MSTECKNVLISVPPPFVKHCHSVQSNMHCIFQIIRHKGNEWVCFLNIRYIKPNKTDKSSCIQLIHNNSQHCSVVTHKIQNNTFTFSVYSSSTNPSISSWVDPFETCVVSMALNRCQVLIHTQHNIMLKHSANYTARLLTTVAYQSCTTTFWEILQRRVPHGIGLKSVSTARMNT